MLQRDIIKDQIDQLGKVLGRILGDFMGFKANGQVAQGIEVSKEQLKTELDVDIDTIILLNKTDLQTYLEEDKWTSDNLEQLIEYVFEWGKHEMTHDPQKAIVLLNQTLELYDVLLNLKKVYPLNRIDREAEINQMIQELKNAL